MDKIKTKKIKKGIFRFEAILPTLFILGLICLYLVFFFDHNIRKALEWGLTHAHGAEVNIAQVKTSVKDLKVGIYGVQFTYDRDPKLDVVRFDEISLHFIWKALLQAKYIVPDSNIKNIQTMVERKKPGRVLKLSDKTGYRGIQSGVENNIKEQVSENIVSDLYQLSKGTDVDDQLKSLQYELKSDQYVKNLEKEIKEKEEYWKKRIDQLPKKEEFKKYEQRAKALSAKSKNGLEIAGRVKEASKLYKEVQATIQSYKTTSSDLKKDVSKYSNEIKGIDKLIKSDLQGIKNKLKIPSINPSDISKGVFFPIIQSKLVEFKRYIAMVQSYLPEKKKENKEQVVVPRKRGRGKNYYFPKKNSYPKFWIKNVNVSSTVNEKGFNGNFAGKITNITNNPKHIGLPIIADIKGDAPQQQVRGIQALITVDHREDIPKETVEFSVDSFPTKNLVLSKGSDLAISMAKSLLASKISATHSNNNIQLNLKNEFKQPNYNVEGKSESLKKVVLSTLNKMPALTLNGSVKGTWKDFDLSLNSNFGSELSKAFKQKINDKVKEAEDKIKSKLFGSSEKAKEKLQSRFKKFSSGSLSDLKGKEGHLDKIKKEISDLKNGKGALKKLKSESLKKEGKKLLKGLFK